ncbi:D-alanyl-D-alanine carboxypeptidase/D-alanyl-D-alanine endopeptidase [Sphingobium boeckii]|uniref:D-alanyl-D-alanine carboxypeptidase/D-alanyl-D-alanine-endopeptidase (Penicillin-binding protein 4) n=1 Tax=Sphingobium boeckii TaxID=1082345 RepID=A0A7W9AJI9_9SPHN|nr:D-alanyl-D-alanine carboxypeptidase/D-alanyl-D-alanine-endopeptidase [Sphingobium boeckii]MBB5686830.1 D-alanyl-D-alanine carboxypeptidase/D-alanyl-D-alanine-endopeptidase (penicillin-binding protein 4) [Sphingobium boeckii]
MKIIPAACLILLFTPLPAAAQQTLQQRVEARLKAVGPGPRFGLVIATADGREIIAIAPDDRFIPASNTKMFTTAAAFATLPALDQPDATGGAAVRLEGKNKRRPDVILEGHGDARLSSAPGCVDNCLAALADAVAARTRTVGDIIGDDMLFPDQRWSPGMSWNNIPTRSGTATSALTLDDNELELFVAPGAAGSAPIVTAPLRYYTIQNHAVTIAEGKTAVDFDRAPGSMTLRITGTIALGTEPQRLRPAIDDPAYYAAWRFKALLEARGVRVKGRIGVRHRPLLPADDPAQRGDASPARPPERPVLARLVPPPLGLDLVTTNKVSHNLHAELLLRRVGLQAGTGSIADGQAAIRNMLTSAGVPRTAYDFSDGSGMSTYNRVAPRGMVIFLRWIAAQPWGSAWRDTLPIAGMDGTLANRFRATSLERRLFAKTGTLNATNALSGYMIAKSGRTLTFSIYANDVPEGVSATPAMDAALELVAAEN